MQLFFLPCCKFKKCWIEEEERGRKRKKEEERGRKRKKEEERGRKRKKEEDGLGGLDRLGHGAFYANEINGTPERALRGGRDRAENGSN